MLLPKNTPSLGAVYLYCTIQLTWWLGRTWTQQLIHTGSRDLLPIPSLCRFIRCMYHMHVYTHGTQQLIHRKQEPPSNIQSVHAASYGTGNREYIMYRLKKKSRPNNSVIVDTSHALTSSSFPWSHDPTDDKQSASSAEAGRCHTKLRLPNTSRPNQRDWVEFWKDEHKKKVSSVRLRIHLVFDSLIEGKRPNSFPNMLEGEVVYGIAT